LVYLVVQAIIAKVVSGVAVDRAVVSVGAEAGGVSGGGVVVVSVKVSLGISLSFGLTLAKVNDVSGVIEGMHNSLGSHSVDDRGGDDRGGQAVGVGDNGLDDLVDDGWDMVDMGQWVDMSSVGQVLDGLLVGSQLRGSLLLGLGEVRGDCARSWVEFQTGVNRADNWGGQASGVGDWLDQVVGTNNTSTVDSTVGAWDEESWVSLSLGLGLGISLTLDEAGAKDMGVSSGVGDNGAGHGLVDNGEGLVDHGGVDHGGGVDQGLVQVSVGLSSQVLGLGGLDGQGLARDNSSIGMLHLGLNLGVGIAINQRLGKEHLRVSLWGSLGGSGQSNSDESLHCGCKVFVLLAFLR